MSRILVLLPVALWFVWADAHAQRQPFDWAGVTVFLAGLPILLTASAYLTLRAARGVYGPWRRGTALARSLTAPALLAWHAVGLFALGWGDVVSNLLGGATPRDLALPGAVLATLPTYLAWAALPLAEWPRARRKWEARLLDDVDAGRGVTLPPTLFRHWLFAVRGRLLFALLPLAALMLLRDLATLSLHAVGVEVTGNVSALLLVLSAVFVIALSPELLRRILPTRPLPPGPLRDGLEAMCRRARLPMRDVLVWDTDRQMVNAAVIGFLPGVRYVLFTDLLLETMSPQQVAGVFAHELGHVRHRHIQWYVLFLAGVTLFLGGPVDAAWRWLGVGDWLPAMSPQAADYAAAVGGLGAILLGFGLLSRCFERQADVFAARTMQAVLTPGETRRFTRIPVGVVGASAFASSLATVGHLNALPMDRPRRRLTVRNALGWTLEQLTHFLHGTIRSRMDYLLRLAAKPTATRRFDRFVVGVKLAVLLVGLGSGWFVWEYGG